MAQNLTRTCRRIGLAVVVAGTVGTVTTEAEAFVDPCSVSCYAYVVLCCPKPCPVVKISVAGTWGAAQALLTTVVDTMFQTGTNMAALALAMGQEGVRATTMLGWKMLGCSPKAPPAQTLAAVGANTLNQRELADPDEAHRSLVKYMVAATDARVGQLLAEQRRVEQARRTLDMARANTADWRDQMRIAASYRALTVGTQAATESANAARMRLRAPSLTVGLPELDWQE